MKVLKGRWFAKAAKKTGISDRQLYKAALEVAKGQCDNLGGGVYKKRLNKNLSRSIVLFKAGECVIFEFLFDKKDRENIEDDELGAFKKLAKAYAAADEKQLAKLIVASDLVEICDDSET